jgi:hypothetical protein
MTEFGFATSYRRGRGDVYRCVNAEGRTIYVGRSFNAVERTKSRQRTAPWWLDVATVFVRNGGAVEERGDIARYRPEHNRHGNPDWHKVRVGNGWQYQPIMRAFDWLPIDVAADEAAA